MQTRHMGFTLWFTGLPCSGKSTLAQLVAVELERRGYGTEILDGDVVRTHLTKGLGFSKADRDENIRRIGFVCKLLSKHGAVAIAAAISPYRNIREEIRSTIENFVEVHVKAPIEVCITRDVKGMYRKALAGEIKNFTGIDDPYEAPIAPEVIVETAKETPEDSTTRILTRLEQLSLIEPLAEASDTREDAQQIREKLVRLRYIER